MKRLESAELFIGAWVVRHLDDGHYSSPHRVYGIWENGDCSLLGGDAVERVSLGELGAIPINASTLLGFGFEKARGNDVYLLTVGAMRMTVSLRWKHGEQQCRRVALTGKTTCWNEEIRYVHELQRWWVDRVLLPFGIPLVLEWHGNEEEV